MSNKVCKTSHGVRLTSHDMGQLKCHDAFGRNIVIPYCQFEIKCPITLAMGQVK